jgi:hypothetical protein
MAFNTTYMYMWLNKGELKVKQANMVTWSEIIVTVILLSRDKSP